MYKNKGEVFGKNGSCYLSVVPFFAIILSGLVGCGSSSQQAGSVASSASSQSSVSSQSSARSLSSSENGEVDITVATRVTGSGTINPTSYVLPVGESTQFDILPAPGYEVAELSGCSGHLQGHVFSTEALQEPCEIHVQFSAKPLVAPALTVSYQAYNKKLFAWEATGNAFYKLIEIDENGDERTLADDITADTTQLLKRMFIPAHLQSSYKLLSCTDDACAASAPIAPSGEAMASIQYLRAPAKAGFWSQGFGNYAKVGETTADVYAPSYLVYEDIHFRPSDLVVFSAMDAGELYPTQHLETSIIRAVTIDAAEENLVLALRSSLSSWVGGMFSAWYTKQDEAWVRRDHQLWDRTEERQISSLSISENGKVLAVALSAATGDPSILSEVWLYAVGEEITFITAVGPEVSAQSDQFGASVDLSANGDVLVVGAPGEGSGLINGEVAPLDNSKSQSGAVYVFNREGDVWRQAALVKSPNPTSAWWDCYTGTCAPGELSGVNFGAAVAVSDDGDLLAIGAPGENKDKGAAYLYRASSPSEWDNIERLELAHGDSKLWLSEYEHTGGDQFGYSLALSGDGRYLAVGAPFEESSALGFNADTADNALPFSGAVMLYTLNAGEPEASVYIKPSHSESHYFGLSVDLSVANGYSLIVSQTSGVFVY